MKLHRLEIRAFGPFPGSEEVDFDELNDAGLFLLTGPTGAGKTCILDAICFALYGQVPGSRGNRTLKSQHAADDAVPEVLLDLSIRERRFVVRRSPEWTRPKRRGTGTTEVKPSVTLMETTDGHDHLLSSRAQEVGLLLNGLLGMHAAQFQQVALLPQGEFQVFLRASSQERHDVLQRLFKTDRFSRIEDWVTDHGRTLRERADSGRGQVQRLLDTMADRVGVELPEALSGPALSSTSGSERVLPWAETCLADAVAAHAVAEAAHAAASSVAVAARAAHDRDTRLALLAARRDEALESLAALATTQDVEHAARAALAADERAGRCTAVLDLRDDAALAVTAAGKAREQALTALVDGLADPSSAALAEAERSLRGRITLLEALLPRERSRRHAIGELARATRQHDAAGSAVEAARARREQLPDRRSALSRQLAEATATARRVEALRVEVAAAEGRLAAARQMPRLSERRDALKDAERDARDRAADARQRVQELVSLRLAGMAAELADRLADGVACQVCGSTDHPHPATPGQEAVTEADQRAAAQVYDTRSAELTDAGERAAAADRALDAARHAAGGLAPPAAEWQTAELKKSLTAAERAALLADELADALQVLGEEQQALGAQLEELRTQRALAAQQVDQLRGLIAEISASIAAAVGSTDDDRPLEEVLGDLGAALAAVLGGVRAATEHDEAWVRLDALTEQASALVTEHGFDTLEAARSSILTAQRRAELHRRVAVRGELRVRCEGVLAEPEVEALGEEAAPDPVVSAQAVAEAELALQACMRALHTLDEVVRSLETGVARLAEAMRRWSPVRAESERAESMSRLVRGIGSDNQLQMRLSAYVLATRLDQVVDAANERLAQLRDQRYLLQRTARAARKGSQAGLGLEVIDEWTGDVREPATLSGGETFVVSLSLALGLADVVTQEAGGAEIETLFIDEGFGMLDADTLDDVMDRLDGLRAGGRTVGVVSHVTEMRNRIPTQVHVDKGRTGSSVAVRTLVG